MSAPAARQRVRDSGGAELLDRLEWMDARRGRPAPPAPVPLAPDASASLDYDVLIAGGGLSLLIAPLLADHGLKVAVIDRGTIGAVHREWNASEPELAPLWETGLFTREEVDDLVIARYREGVCRWHGGGAWPVRGVLDHAVDAGRLLAEVRRRAEARGVTLLDHHLVEAESSGRGGVAVGLRAGDGRERLSARLLVDARGAASPHAHADLVCPTVGGVLDGLVEGTAPDEMDPKVGEILATTEDVEERRQHIWEAFPGRPGQTTVYLFYYARSRDVGAGSLVELYARFFERLPRYKRGDARLVRPTFGYITGWSRLGPAPRPPAANVVLFGDAAARHSPLTYCGFGHMLRTFGPAARSIAGRLAGEPARDVAGDAPVHALTGALSSIMANPPPGAAMNRLLDAAFSTLHEMGPEPYAALLKDEMSGPDFVSFLRETSRKHPAVYREVAGRLSLPRLARWGWNLARAARGR